MEQKVRVGILGIGNMGTGHANSILKGLCPGLTLTAVCDINPKRLEWMKEKKEEVLRFATAEEFFSSGAFEACIISVPHYDHPRYAIECMRRGIHVMLEKPAGVYTAQVRQMNEETKKHPQVVFGMMFNQRTNHIYRAMRQLVQSGKYGAIRRTNWIVTDWYRQQTYYDSGGWRATWAGEGGGVLLNQCPHNLDLWQWICGMPVKVEAHMGYGRWHEIEVEDDVTAYVEYENGATGVFITSTGDACGTNRFEIQMDKAKLLAENGQLVVLEYEKTEQEFSRSSRPFEAMPYRRVEVETDGKNEQHVGVLNAWADSILKGTPLIASGEEGIKGLMLSNAMHLSSFLGRPVTLPIEEELFYRELQKRIVTSRHKEVTEAVTVDLSGTFEGSKLK